MSNLFERDKLIHKARNMAQQCLTLLDAAERLTTSAPHNPEKVRKADIGKGYRLLTVEEFKKHRTDWATTLPDIEYRPRLTLKAWSRRSDRVGATISLNPCITYRTPVGAPGKKEKAWSRRSDSVAPTISLNPRTTYRIPVAVPGKKEKARS